MFSSRLLNVDHFKSPCRMIYHINFKIYGITNFSFKKVLEELKQWNFKLWTIWCIHPKSFLIVIIMAMRSLVFYSSQVISFLFLIKINFMKLFKVESNKLNPFLLIQMFVTMKPEYSKMETYLYHICIGYRYSTDTRGYVP